MKNLSKHLFLTSGSKNGEGFWLIGIKNSDENILAEEYLLDCHRKELIGNDSAEEILFAINLNLNNIFNDLEKNNFFFKKPSLVISFNIPLDVLENIFDFWVDIYKDKEAWDTCLGLLKIRKKFSLTNLINSGSLKGDSMKWAIEIETLHKYVPNSLKNDLINEPMWK